MIRARYAALAIVVALLAFGCEKEPVGLTDDIGVSLTKVEGCTTIQDGTLFTEAKDGAVSVPIVLGSDEFGYNYQAHMFNGRYCDYDRVIDGAFCDVDLIMKWNDAWLSNKDCDEDDLLDRSSPYIGSGAWLTNHQAGEYVVDGDGEICEWDYFVKIIAAPADADLIDGIWYNADDTEIGPAIWGSFAIIQQVENDLCAGLDGMQYVSPDHPGFGGW